MGWWGGSYRRLGPAGSRHCTAGSCCEDFEMIRFYMSGTEY